MVSKKYKSIWNMVSQPDKRHICSKHSFQKLEEEVNVYKKYMGKVSIPQDD